MSEWIIRQKGVTIARVLLTHSLIVTTQKLPRLFKGDWFCRFVTAFDVLWKVNEFGQLANKTCVIYKVRPSVGRLVVMFSFLFCCCCCCFILILTDINETMNELRIVHVLCTFARPFDTSPPGRKKVFSKPCAIWHIDLELYMPYLSLTCQT